ncbi:hypothetical protein SARC_03419 [Sphaeroforma arctica JP610]|uniref:Mediator of RNA polymerase II transcription subunit 20 n=1 Tax=Sphaeroforma arctica JP610 TaxID=667725 RepID=A0A0L0G5Z7_9EUKA|nr:hypothetical protein SARC_03419 [Sphaeroforma arctica JP610]KNC84374.1 hypothetical protein SARC_03419 [Sphaeroforma arctica JP610]|eukprot:XP_014158276.1 hypothetical protein SARC_03419 [Sphaeroforma arctica JP610]
MGVCKVFILDPNDKSLVELYSVEKLYSRIESLCGQRAGNWKVECDLWQYGPKTMHTAKFSHIKNKRYTLSGNLLMEASEEIEAIIIKLKNWVKRKSAKMEGISFNLGDFTIEVGSVVVGSQDRGIIMRMAYGASTSQAQCVDLLTEMYTMIFRCTQTIPSTDEVFPVTDFQTVGLDPEDCGDRHMAFQYMTALKQSKIL